MSNLDGSNKGSLALRGTRLLFMLPSLLALLLTGVYALGVWAGLNLAALNILCLFLYFAQAAPGCIESVNRKKAASFIGTLFISLAAVWLNFQAERLSLQGLRLRDLSGWSGAWAALLLAAAVSAAVVFARLLRWSQEQWEAVRKLRQEHRLKTKKFWQDYIFSNKTYRLTMKDTLIKIRGQIEQERLDNKKVENNTKQESRLNILKIKLQKKYEKKTSAEAEKGEKKINFIFLYKRGVSLFVSIAIVFLFFLLPRVDGITDSISAWTRGVSKLTVALIGGEELESELQALFLYLLIYTLAVAAVGSLVYLIYCIIRSGLQNKKDESFTFLDAYKTPISILLVSVIFLFAFTSGKAGLPEVTRTWEFLFFTFLFILVIFTAIEVVRLFLEQCVEPESLLKETIYLLFVVILKALSELLLSVIMNFRIQLIVSSLLTLVFPGAKTCFDRLIDSKLCKLFHDEILFGHEKKRKDQLPVLRRFRRRQIWRRNQK